LIDLRSDTVTRPTPEMRKAMAEAEVGDDVFREDPTVARLQERAAELLGFEAALFVPSGTMGNQIAVKLHTRPGQEVVTEARAHIYNWEMATMAAFSGCLARPVAAPRGILTWELIEPVLSPPVYYRARTGLVTLENTHNMAGGTVMTVGETEAVVRGARRRGLPVHLDGARIFNAGAALGESAARLAAGCDSVMFCLSKGLAAPVGSLLLGSRDFVEEAWVVRKMLGGGMRQVGVLAAAGLVALERMPSRLAEDHDNARRLALGLADLPGCGVDPESLRTNIVMLDLEKRSSRAVLESLRGEGVLAVATGPRQVRFVTHKDVTRRDVDRALEAVRRVLA
jgi:threonine aldolase